jgi:hypothetical protein
MLFPVLSCARGLVPSYIQYRFADKFDSESPNFCYSLFQWLPQSDGQEFTLCARSRCVLRPSLASSNLRTQEKVRMYKRMVWVEDEHFTGWCCPDCPWGHDHAPS